jgi:hypothetical protein
MACSTKAFLLRTARRRHRGDSLSDLNCWTVSLPRSPRFYRHHSAQRLGVFFFRSKLIYREGEGQPDRNLAATVSGGPHASRDSFYRTARSGRQGRSGVIPLNLLPRRCPVCRNDTIIGHGRRLRQSHDHQHESIWVRRGICEPCRKSFTILPNWLAPSAPFTLHCRQQACELLAVGATVERAAPHCKDPTRLPDPSTVRRWAQRRLTSLWCWLKAGDKDRRFMRAPTILAWDLGALRRILPIEARSP